MGLSVQPITTQHKNQQGPTKVENVHGKVLLLPSIISISSRYVMFYYVLSYYFMIVLFHFATNVLKHTCKKIVHKFQIFEKVGVKFCDLLLFSIQYKNLQ